MSDDLRALPIGHIFSDYRIEGILGQGGFGITYLAVDTMLNLRVAIKEYFPREFALRDGTFSVRAAGNNDDKEFFKSGLQRFLEEARVLALFDHPNIVGVRRFFEGNGTAYLVMDYCDGEPLDEYISRNGPLNSEQLNKLIVPILDGLERIHNANFLHRDIKPANIYIRSNGSPVLLDFGAARQELASHSRSVTSYVTEGYAAVEQYSTRGKQSPATDIYGFGATLYRAITDIKPEPSSDRLLQDTLIPASIACAGRYHENILLGIDRAMKVRPEERPQSIKEWRKILGTVEVHKRDAASGSTPINQAEPDKKVVPERVVRTPKGVPGGGYKYLYWAASIFLIGFIVYAIYTQLPATKNASVVKPTPIPEVQGGIASNATTDTWEKAVEKILSRKKAGKIALGVIATSDVSDDFDTLKGTLSKFVPLPQSEVAKMEASNIWYYTKSGKFGIRLINPSTLDVDSFILQFSSDCKSTRNFKYALINLRSPMPPGKEVLYEGDLPLGGKLNLQGYGCAVVQEAYTLAAPTSPPVAAPSSQPQVCVGTYSSSWTNCIGTQNFGADTQWAGQKYVGSFVDGKRQGKGTYTWSNGDKYVGDFKNNSPNGQGVFTWADGSSYSGSFKDGLKSGYGTQKWANGTKYVGEYKNDVRNGKGVLYAVDGSVISSGTWEGGFFKGSISDSKSPPTQYDKSSNERMSLCSGAANEVNKERGKVIDNITKLRNAVCYKTPNGDVVFSYNYDITASLNINQTSLDNNIRPGRIKKWCDDKELKPLLDLFIIQDVYFDQNNNILGKVTFSKSDCR